jgi:hypothetical protein
MDKKRVYLEDGVAIQLWHGVWSVDIYRRGKRLRKSLETGDRGRALMLAGGILSSLKEREAEINWLADDLPFIRRFVIETAKVLELPEIPPLAKKTVDAWEKMSVDRLRNLALEGTSEESRLLRIVQSEREKNAPAAVAVDVALISPTRSG